MLKKYTIQEWEEIRKNGKKHFLLKVGCFQWGTSLGLMFGIFMAIKMPPNGNALLLFSLALICFGFPMGALKANRTWKAMEEQYSENIKAGAVGAQQSPSAKELKEKLLGYRLNVYVLTFFLAYVIVMMPIILIFKLASIEKTLLAGLVGIAVLFIELKKKFKCPSCDVRPAKMPFTRKCENCGFKL